MNIKVHKNIKIIFWTMFVFCLFLTLLFTYIRYPYWLNSDMSAEIIAAKKAISEGGILSKNWYYGTELRLLTPVLIYEFLLLFTSNFYVIRAITIPIVLLIFLLSIYFMTSKTGYKDYYPLIAALFLTPFSINSFYNTYVVSGYQMYAFYISLMFISMGFLFANNLSKKQRIFSISILSIISILLGVNGPRHLVVFYFPVFIVCLFLYLLDIKKREDSITFLDSKLFDASIALISNLIGLVICYTAMRNNFDFFSYDIKIVLPNLNSIKTAFFNLFENLGYNTFNNFFGIISNILFACSLVLFLIYFIFFIKNYKKLTYNDKVLTFFFCFSLLIMFCYFIFVEAKGNGYLINYSQYLLFDLCFGFYFIPILLKNNETIQFKFPKVKIIPKLTLGFFCVLSLFSYSSFFGYTHWSQHYKFNEDIINVANFLKTKEYKIGYATHWNGLILNELTNNMNLEMFVFNEINNKAEINREVQDKTHEINFLRDENCFVIFRLSEYSYQTYRNAINYGTRIYTSESYSIFDLKTAKILNY